MSYELHNFKNGDRLSATALNRMDEQLYENTVIEREESLTLIQGAYHAGYHTNSSNTAYTKEIAIDRERTFEFDGAKYKVLLCKFKDGAYIGNTDWTTNSPLIVSENASYDSVRVEIRLRSEASTDFSVLPDIVKQKYIENSAVILKSHDAFVIDGEKKLSEITQIIGNSYAELSNYTNGAFVDMNGNIRNSNDYMYSDYIAVNGGDYFKGECYGASSYCACVTFYDSGKDIDKSLTITPPGTQYVLNKVEFEFRIPKGIKYIRFSREKNGYAELSYVINDYYGVLKSNVRRILNSEKVSASSKFAHLSFDDVRYCMQDITNNASTYTSVFNNPFFDMLRTLHDNYGIVVSLYLFVDDSDGWTDKFKDEFKANASWLKFGLHENGHNYESTSAETALSDYNKFTALIMRICGSVECVDRCPRLGSFKGNLDSIIAMRDADCGIVGLLSAYDDRDSYYLDSANSAYVFKHGKLIDNTNHITFYRSLAAMEATSPESTLPVLNTLAGANGNAYLIEMMHEYGVYNSSYQLVSSMVDRLSYGAAFAVTNGYSWDFPQNRC